jgi:hypothetical protein
MFLAHSIRLRDPWQCESLEGGALRWSRVFHRPTGLEPDDSLCLVISGLPPEAQVTVNGHAFEPKDEVPAPSPLRGADQASTGDPKSPERRAVAFAQQPGRGLNQESAANHPSLALPVKGREPEESCVEPARSLSQFDVTAILADDNRIEIHIPPQASSFKPQASSFPYDARLAILGRS